MAYPDYKQTNESSMTLVDDLQLDRSSNGGLRGRAMYPTVKHRFAVVHPVMNATEVAALMTYYSTNRLLAFDFTWQQDRVTRTCWFGGPPKFDYVGAGLWKPTVQIEEQ